MVTEQERRAEGSTFAEMRLFPSWKQLRREEMAAGDMLRKKPSAEVRCIPQRTHEGGK